VLNSSHLVVGMPFVPIPAGSAKRFLEESDLTADERVMVASGNWERLRGEIRR
jgi:uncharacterized protein